MPAPAHVRIDVVNGCGVARAGRDVMREMLAAGFNVYAVRNSTQHWGHTTVVDRLDPEGRNACIVSEALEVPRCFLGIDIGLRVRPECRVEIDSTRYVDAEVVVGSDYRLFFPGARPAH
ncbi:MAG: LytR C-terminal domain-containing protein [candidate division WOR-3 bacterium]